ncbi:MAG TPA: condensation domain-containing protein [Candidatus Angelobacter sp.]|jgi:hypothetical protein|nr:condensation domain-containing protein [Candidatus Angelobacter sp.]
MRTPAQNPLSATQHRLWLLTQSFESGPLNMVLPIRMAGPMNICALELALTDVIERHHSLQTGICDRTGESVLHLRAGTVAHPQLSVIRATPASIATIAQSSLRRFDLAEELPLRPHLIAYTHLRHTLHLVVHPMAFDPWSVRPLLSDLMTAYVSRCKGWAPRWLSPAPQYSDYLSRQARTIGEERDISSPAGRQLAYWTGVLHDVPRINFPVSLSTSDSTNSIPVRLNPEIHRRLLLLGKTAKASLLMVLHSIVVLSLSRLIAASDIVVATLISGRKRGPFHEIIGPLANIIRIRTNVCETENFSSVLERVREAYILAYANSDVEWGRVAEACGDKSGLNVIPAEVMVTIQKNTRSIFSKDTKGITVQTGPMFPSMFGCKLTCEFVEWCGTDGGPEGIEGKLRFHASKVDKAFVSLLVEEFLQVVKSALKYPGPSGDKETLPDQECMMAQAPVEVSRGPHSPTLPRALPASSSANKERQSVQSSFGSSTDPYRVYIGSGNPTQARLIQIWEELLGVRRIGVWDKFADLGGNKFLFARMIKKISAIYHEDISVGPGEEDSTTVAELAARLVQKVPLKPRIEIQAGDRRTPPFWFLHGDFSGLGLYCRELCTFVDKEQPFYVLPPHGTNGRSIPDLIEEMASDCIQSIYEVQPHGPFCLGGYCIGGLVAWEIAARLRKAGEHVAAVILIDAGFNIDFQASKQKKDESEAIGVKARKGQIKPEFEPPRNSDDAFARYVQAGRSYCPSFYPGKVFLLCRFEKFFPEHDPVSCWRSVSQDLTVRWITGGHITAFSRHIGGLGATLEDCLAAIRQSAKH